MSGVRIGEAAGRVRLSVDAVRYYEAAGLIPRVPRDPGGRRVFDDASLAWLEHAVCLRALGMPVQQVAEYVAAASSGAAGTEVRDRMRRHLERMRHSRDQLDEYVALVEAKLLAMESS